MLTCGQVFSVRRVTSHPEYTVSVKSRLPAAFVWLQAPSVPGHFSDNGFLMTSRERDVTFYADEDVAEEDVEEALSIMSLHDIYK